MILKKQSVTSIRILFICLASFLFYSCIISSLGGAYDYTPKELKSKISKEALQLINKSFSDIDPKKLMDYHTHIVGIGTNQSGIHVNPRMLSWMHPLHRLKFLVYFSAANIQDEANADKDYLRRLNEQIQYIPSHGKYGILAFDKYYNSLGKYNPEKTEFYVPNKYIWKIASDKPEYFVPIISIHPARADALERLDHWAKKGAKVIKWLPNAMGMNPGDPKYIPFYKQMKRHKMILLVHAGEEKAVDVAEDQKLGNPLHLRLPLDLGVRVIISHCASLGTNEDLDDPARPEIENFDLFLRLMSQKKYNGLLFAEISAMTQANRLSRPLAQIIKLRHLHSRLVNGSDYPLPAINVVIRTGKLESEGFISTKERKLLNEIYNYNPLLFDYVLKRTLRAPGTNLKLSPSIFEKNPGLE